MFSFASSGVFWFNRANASPSACASLFAGACLPISAFLSTSKSLSISVSRFTDASMFWFTDIDNSLSDDISAFSSTGTCASMSASAHLFTSAGIF